MITINKTEFYNRYISEVKITRKRDKNNKLNLEKR